MTNHHLKQISWACPAKNDIASNRILLWRVGLFASRFPTMAKEVATHGTMRRSPLFPTLFAAIPHAAFRVQPIHLYINL